MNEQINEATVDAPAPQPTGLQAVARLAEELDLFSVADGAVLWQPRGARLRNLVERVVTDAHFEHGYELASAALGFYQRRERREHELPMRLAGLHGAGEAHIFATREQMPAELARALDFCLHVARTFGLGELTVRGHEVLVHDADGRAWPCASVAVDPALAERAGLAYVGADGQKHRAVVLRRGLFGSIDRLVEALIEHHGGAFPLWLAPVQARVVAVTSAHHAWAEEVRETLAARGLRVDLDLTTDKLNAKIRTAQVEKIPLALVCGDKEVAARALAPRTREGQQMPAMPLAEFAQWMEHEALIPRPPAKV